VQGAEHAVAWIDGIDQRPGQGRATPASDEAARANRVDVGARAGLVVDRRGMAFDSEEHRFAGQCARELKREELLAAAAPRQRFIAPAFEHNAI